MIAQAAGTLAPAGSSALTAGDWIALAGVLTGVVIAGVAAFYRIHRAGIEAVTAEARAAAEAARDGREEIRATLADLAAGMTEIRAELTRHEATRDRVRDLEGRVRHLEGLAARVAVLEAKGEPR